jgi:tRNA (guanine-N7-)-methyltransferase
MTHLRRVRSFTRRPGRVTKAQARALTELWPHWGIDVDGEKLDLDAIFGRRAERVLDIGFGDGEALLTAAANFSSIDYVGAEVHEPGVGHLLLLLERAGLENVRIIGKDIVEASAMLPDNAFAAVNLFFPDPWPKKRHHKRRLVQPEFVATVARVLEPGGLLHIATDWEDYAMQIRRVMTETDAFVAAELNADSDPIAFRAPTKFERRGRRLGHDVYELYYRLVGD